jgi:hypothetical protein
MLSKHSTTEPHLQSEGTYEELDHFSLPGKCSVTCVGVAWSTTKVQKERGKAIQVHGDALIFWFSGSQKRTNIGEETPCTQ